MSKFSNKSFTTISGGYRNDSKGKRREFSESWRYCKSALRCVHRGANTTREAGHVRFIEEKMLHLHQHQQNITLRGDEHWIPEPLRVEENDSELPPTYAHSLA
eukprot:684490_1